MSPDVFSHPVWVNFIDSDQLPSDPIVHELLRECKQLITDGDVYAGCQVLFLCAFLHKQLGNYEASMENLHEAWKQADAFKLADIAEWAAWGCSALCLQQGDTDEAIKYLKLLRIQLSNRGDWILADLLELFVTALFDPAQGSELFEIPLSWLLEWGKPSNDGKAHSHQIRSDSTNGHSRLEYFLSLITREQWISLWRDIKKIARGQLRLKWVEKKNHREDTSEISGRVSLSSRTISHPEGQFHQPSSNMSPFTSLSISRVPEFPAPSDSLVEQKSAILMPVDFADDRLLLAVYCLGQFRVSLKGQWITHWPSGKGKAIFKYLIANHKRPIKKDILMDTFWRDADPAAARNNLYVAIYGLRQAFKAIHPDSQTVLFDDDHYSLNPALVLWLDFEEFNRHYQAGQASEKSGRLLEAIELYEAAASLYQGDFLSDDLYDEWPIQIRERLRITYLDTLDHMSRINLNQGQYLACVSLCHLILDRDNCREDAHRRLMICYSRQGQHHLALAQYQACVEALSSVLDVDPEPTTSQLAERIRRHDKV